MNKKTANNATDLRYIAAELSLYYGFSCTREFNISRGFIKNQGRLRRFLGEYYIPELINVIAEKSEGNRILAKALLNHWIEAASDSCKTPYGGTLYSETARVALSRLPA